MTHIFVLIDPITGAPIWVAPTLAAAKDAATLQEVNPHIGQMAVPIYRFEQREGNKARNGVKVAEVTI